MSVSFEDFLQSAEILLNNKESKEIDYRNLISRSYYAVFHLGRQKAEILPLTISDEKYRNLASHQKVISKYENSRDVYLKALGRQMSLLKTKRCRADYDIHVTIERKEAEKHIFAVKEVIKKLQQLQIST
jgi:uncharacterized protein (UPF0332 family)